MDLPRLAARLYAALSSVVALFQLALALGAPWGAYAMGGAFPGRLPPPMRVAAIVQALLLCLLCAVVLSRAGLALPRWARASRWAIWVIVAWGALGLALNLATPSAAERLLWAPVALVLLACSVVVATGPKPGPRS